MTQFLEKNQKTWEQFSVGTTFFFFSLNYLVSSSRRKYASTHGQEACVPDSVGCQLQWHTPQLSCNDR